MFEINIDDIINNLINTIVSNLELYLPKIVWALFILWIWIIMAIAIHKLVMYFFKRFKLIELIDKLNIDFDDDDNIDDKKNNEKESKVKTIKKKISDKIKINEITAKAMSYYIFLVFFRLSIVVIWIEEVEVFLWDLLTYLPSLFIAVIIWFFWVRFANFIHDIVFHALELTKQKTAKIIASWAKVIVLFFTLMVVLGKVGIASEITNTILIWFISMLALSWGLAFWLGWRDIAKEILESFRK